MQHSKFFTLTFEYELISLNCHNKQVSCKLKEIENKLYPIGNEWEGVFLKREN